MNTKNIFLNKEDPEMRKNVTFDQSNLLNDDSLKIDAVDGSRDYNKVSVVKLDNNDIYSQNGIQEDDELYDVDEN